MGRRSEHRTPLKKRDMQIYEKEVWKDVPESKGKYQASNLGRVKSVFYNRTKTPQILKPSTTKNGYLKLGLWIHGSRKHISVHRIIASTFLGGCPKGCQGNHKNGIKTENRIENLEYCTPQENTLHAHRNSLTNTAKGEDSGSSKLTEKQVIEIRELCNSFTLNKIASMYNVSYSLISMIKNRHIWKHI